MRRAFSAMLPFWGVIATAFFGTCVGEGQKTPSIMVETDLVPVNIIVLDEHGTIVPDLKASDFRIREDGVVQRIEHFSYERVPVTFMLLLDRSGSVEHRLPFIREAAEAFLEPYPDAISQLLSGDEFALILFASHAEFVQFDQQVVFSGNLDMLRNAVGGENGLIQRVESKESGTALYDAIYLAGTDVLREAVCQKCRRAMILVTDGGENSSRFSRREIKSLLEEIDTRVFAVIPPKAEPILVDILRPSQPAPGQSQRKKKRSRNRGPWSEEIPIEPSQQKTPIPFPHIYVRENPDPLGPAEERGPGNLKDLAEMTGGAVFTANKYDKLSDIVRALSRVVRYQYLLGYAPNRTSAVSHPSKWDGSHHIDVELYPPGKFPNYRLYFRRRYKDPYQ